MVKHFALMLTRWRGAIAVLLPRLRNDYRSSTSRDGQGSVTGKSGMPRADSQKAVQRLLALVASGGEPPSCKPAGEPLQPFKRLGVPWRWRLPVPDALPP